MPKRSKTEITDNWLRRNTTAGLTFCARQRGLGVRVGKHSKTFVFQRDGRRRSLGKYPALTLQEAQKQAQRLWRDSPSDVTWQDAFDSWATDLRLERPHTAKGTIKIRRYQVEKHLASILDQRLSHTSFEDIKRLRQSIGEHGLSTANEMLSWMKTAWVRNSPLEWPADKIKPFKLPKSEKRKMTNPVAFWAEVSELSTNPYSRAFYQIAALTGLRKNDILTMRHDQIKDGWLHVPAPKGGPDRAFDIPLPAQVTQLIDALPKQAPWVLPGKDPSDHLKNPTPYQMRHLPGPHECRHFYRAIAENIVFCPFPVLMKLLNHQEKRSTTDVYGLQWEGDRDAMAEWSQKIADELWERYCF